MLLNLSHESIPIEGLRRELIKGYGIYTPAVRQQTDQSKKLPFLRGKRYVLKNAWVTSTDISYDFEREFAKLAEKAAEQATLAGRWKKHVLNPNAPSDVDTLTETVEAVMDYVAEFGPGSLDLSGLNPADVHCEHLASVLRATSYWQTEIPEWTDALMVASDACKHSGHEVHDVLFGMI